ncbi:MAG: hypothetical protein GX301_06265 [Gracilibacteraceae bacterium]|mgnify:CR=1 FL=1|nr:hypothetical protein [Gracilibacteraceae bacterium]
MAKNRFRHVCIFLILLIIILYSLLIYAGRLPAAYAAFKENIGRSQVSRQLFESYNVMDNTFHFELPDSWSAYEESFSGEEILYHLNFISRDKRIHGFVQVWKLSETLKQFIEKSKESAAGIIDFKNFNIKEINVDGKKGYLMDYSRANQKGEYIRAYEAFIEGFSNKMYRISFFVPEKEWRDYYKILFDRIIHLIKIRK